MHVYLYKYRSLTGTVIPRVRVGANTGAWKLFAEGAHLVEHAQGSMCRYPVGVLAEEWKAHFADVAGAEDASAAHI